MEKLWLEKLRMLVKRLIDIILTLGKQSLALRGHREFGIKCMAAPQFFAHEGNFLELVKLMDDKVLERHLKSPKRIQLI